jgi:hypothetical protein
MSEIMCLQCLIIYGIIQFIHVSKLFCFRKSMRKWYLELNDVNTDLIRSYNIRCKNHQELLDALKQLNVIIQKAARLRGKLILSFRSL